MRNFMMVLLLALLMAGCCVPFPQVVKKADFQMPLEFSTVQVKLDKDMDYFPLSNEQENLNEIFPEIIKNHLTEYGFTLVDENGDIVVLIDKINTGGWSGHNRVTWVKLKVSKGETELFDVTYEQNPAVCGEIYKFWGQLKSPEDIAQIMAGRVARQLKRIE